MTIREVPIREVTIYQVVCDECGVTAYDMEAWADAGGIEVYGRHACRNLECGIAILSTHPDLIARSAANSAGRWWVVFDRRWNEYVMFSEYWYALIEIESSRSLATVMDGVRTR